MINFLKFSIKKLIAGLLHFFWIFPVKTNKVCFMNDHSYTFSDNLKYLCLYLLETEPDKYNIYFSLKDIDEIKEFNETKGYNIKPVRFLSIKHFYHSLTSGIVITNNSGIVYLPIRRKQLVINTWHGGGPYKATGIEAYDNYWYEKELKYSARKFDYYLSSCEVCSKQEATSMYYEPKQVIGSGMPRMDYFFDQKYIQKIREKVFKIYNLKTSQKLVLYAPTFRGLFEDYEGVVTGQNLDIDYHRLLQTLSVRFDGEWHFAIRLHPRLKDVKFHEDDLINMTFYPDAEELLMAADVLITDYSSVMWDYSFSKKPIFLFATDINDYEVKRGFYLPPEKWPYPIACTNDELVDIIRNYEYDQYIQLLQKHYIECGSYESGIACETVKRIIDEHINDF